MQTRSAGDFELANPLVGWEIATAMTRTMFHAMSEWNREMAKFVGHRLEMDAQLQDELARCDNPFNAVDALSKFLQTAFADYAQEARKIQELVANMAEENYVALEAELSPEKAPVIE